MLREALLKLINSPPHPPSVSVAVQVSPTDLTRRRGHVAMVLKVLILAGAASIGALVFSRRKGGGKARGGWKRSDALNAFQQLLGLKGDSKGPLRGIKFAIQDVYDVKGRRTGLGSPALSPRPLSRRHFHWVRSSSSNEGMSFASLSISKKCMASHAWAGRGMTRFPAAVSTCPVVTVVLSVEVIFFSSFPMRCTNIILEEEEEEEEAKRGRGTGHKTGRARMEGYKGKNGRVRVEGYEGKNGRVRTEGYPGKNGSARMGNV